MIFNFILLYFMDSHILAWNPDPNWTNYGLMLLSLTFWATFLEYLSRSKNGLWYIWIQVFLKYHYHGTLSFDRLVIFYSMLT